MQKWCPEPLAIPAGQTAAFELLSPAAASAGCRAASFRPEAGFAGAEAMLRSLSRAERSEVARLIEQDLRREHAARRQAAEDAGEAAEAARRAAEEIALAAWQEDLAAGLERAFGAALGELSRRTSELAVTMAAKIVRREVAADPEALARSLETVLYKAAAGCRLAVTVHPADAAWLAAAPALRERLRIVAVKEDRRLERGGCLVEAEETEWDATIERQLATLGEAVAAALAVPPQPAAGGGDA